MAHLYMSRSTAKSRPPLSQPGTGSEGNAHAKRGGGTESNRDVATGQKEGEKGGRGRSKIRQSDGEGSSLP